MKRRNLICLLFVFTIGVSVFSLTLSFINADTAPVLSVVLSGTSINTTIPAQSVGSTFSVDVRVDNTASVTEGINSVSYALTWDPSVLSCTNVVDPGPFLGSKAEALGSLPPDNTNGKLIIGDIILNPANNSASATGSGVLNTITFTVLSTGQSPLNLQPSDVGVAYLTYPDSSGNSHDVAASVVDAMYAASNLPTPTPTS